MGWSGSAPAPDPSIGKAQQQMADLATEQWNTFKTDIYPKLLEESQKAQTRADEVWAKDKEIADFNLTNSKASQKRYEEMAVPAMEKLKKDADLYNTEGYQEQMAGQAIGDIAAAEEVARVTGIQRERSYGIDPTSGRAGLGFNANNVTAALAKASAGTQTREAAKALGLQKQANVFSMAAGLPLQSLQQSGSALSANAAGMDAGTRAAAIIGGAGSSLNTSANTAMSGWNQVGQLGVSKYQADLEKYKADSAAAGGFGKLVGTLGGAALGGPMGAQIGAKLFG